MVIDESQLADKLKAQGAKDAEEYKREQAAKHKPAQFQGAGHSIRGDAVQAEPPSPISPKNEHTLYMWKDGIR
jgi:hypothetical protein